MFNPTYAVSLPSFFTGLAIDDDGPTTTGTSAGALFGRSLKPWENLYGVSVGVAGELVDEVTIGPPRCWVVGGSVSARQDHQSYDSPTMFDGDSPGPRVETLFAFGVSDT